MGTFQKAPHHDTHTRGHTHRHTRLIWRTSVAGRWGSALWSIGLRGRLEGWLRTPHFCVTNTAPLPSSLVVQEKITEPTSEGWLDVMTISTPVLNKHCCSAGLNFLMSWGVGTLTSGTPQCPPCQVPWTLASGVAESTHAVFI